MGADLVIRTKCMKHMSQIGILVIILRPDWDNNFIFEMKNNLDKQLQDNVIIVELNDNYFCEPMSSTLIRDLLQQEKYDQVIKYTSKDSVDILNKYFEKNKNIKE